MVGGGRIIRKKEGRQEVDEGAIMVEDGRKEGRRWMENEECRRWKRGGGRRKKEGTETGGE